MGHVEYGNDLWHLRPACKIVSLSRSILQRCRHVEHPWAWGNSVASWWVQSLRRAGGAYARLLKGRPG